jgi:hypothetical protein
MPVAIPGGKESLRGRRTRKLAATRPSRKIHLAVRKELLDMADELHLTVTSELRELIEAGDFESIQALLQRLRKEWRERYGYKARKLAGQWVGAADKEKALKMLEGFVTNPTFQADRPLPPPLQRLLKV